MTSFEELPLGPETVAALAAEGIEAPTPFQAAAIPVIARGADLLGRAGPGSGTLVAYVAPLIDRLGPGSGSPGCIVLCTGHRQATMLARSAARLCEGAGLRAAALAPHWNLPERADLLFVPAECAAALYDGTVSVAAVKAVVLHDGDGVVKSVPGDRLEAILSGLPRGCQRVFCGLPFGAPLRSLAKRFTHRAETVQPPRAVPGGRAGGPGRAPTLNLRVLEGGLEEAVLHLAADLLEGRGAGGAGPGGRPGADEDGPAPARHVLLHAASADQAADLGDFLALHGYACGAPGDESVPVWLCPGEEEAARRAVEAAPAPREIATVSCAVPSGADVAAIRHGAAAGPAWVVASVRELGHLRQVAEDAGLALRRDRPERPPRVAAALDELADRIHAAARAPEAAPYYVLVESLLDRFSAAEVAAAALLLLERGAAEPTEKAAKGVRKPGSAAASASVPETWVRLFVSAGQRDEIGPRELLGAITSESGVDGKRVGRIDARESHSLVEVYERDAKAVITALNGITLGGRSLRVDYDRAKERRPPGRGGGPGGGRGRKPGEGPGRKPGGPPGRKPGGAPGRKPGGPPGRGPSRPPFRPGASGTSGRAGGRPRRPRRS